MSRDPKKTNPSNAHDSVSNSKTEQAQAALPLDLEQPQAEPSSPSTTAKETHYYSRSVLAEKLGLSLKELTQLMIDAGWIRQEGKDWILTSKGEFEGGLYRQSKKYGQYIAWPEAIQQHPVIAGVDQQLLSASNIARHYNLSGRLLNRLLAEMGWLQAFAKGWQVTSQGQQMGGQQHQDNDSGIPYVLWPRQLMAQSLFVDTLGQFLAKPEHTPEITVDGEPHFRALDGCLLRYRAELPIANWLYVMGITYAYRRPLALPLQDPVSADFYLPTHHVYIDYWGDDVDPSQLASQLQRRDLYQHYQLKSIEIPHDGLADLDHYLSKALLGLGITVY